MDRLRNLRLEFAGNGGFRRMLRNNNFLKARLRVEASRNTVKDLSG